MIDVTSPETPFIIWPASITSFASDTTIWEDNAIRIKFSGSNNWYFFDSITSGSYFHHTIRIGSSGITPYRNTGTVGVNTTDIYFSNDGSVPGTKFSTTNPVQSKTLFRYKNTATVMNFEIDVLSARDAAVSGEGVVFFIKRFRGESFIPSV